MPPVTRSKDLLSVVDGLFFIDQDVIDLASILFNELKSIIATYGDDCVAKLIPHVGSLMSKLNDLSEAVSGLKDENEQLRDNLSSVEGRYMDINISYKDQSILCCELEDRLENDVCRLNDALAKCKEENERLNEKVRQNSSAGVEGLLTESRERIASLTADRQQLLTTVEVLEADLKCLRAELRQAESRAKKRRTSVGSDLLAELDMIEAACVRSPHPPSTPTQKNMPAEVYSSSPSEPHPSNGTPSTRTQTTDNDFGSVLLIGDSHLRHASKACVKKNAYVECCPGAKIVDIKKRLLKYVGKELSVIYIHVGCNNLRNRYRGGSGYNGGYGKREALHSMADLLYTVRTNFPDSKVLLDSVLVRRDISYKALYGFNEQLELMCYNFGVEFVEANICVRRRDLSRDGVHFNRRGVSGLSALFVDTISAALECAAAAYMTSIGAQDEPTPAILNPDPEGDSVETSSLVNTNPSRVLGN